jgi:soluble lytic murein transglycosylase-like protein
MAFPVSEKLLTPVVIVAAALLIAAAPPSALAPEVPVVCAPDSEQSIEAAAPAAPDAAQQVLTAHLSKRFFIAQEATERMVAAAHRAAGEVGLDPLLILAVIAIESRFNPIAESVMGAKGLMQIIPKYHLDKLRAAGGEDKVFDPESNIHVGTRILQEYVYRGGTLEAGLQQYNGASRDANAYYSQRVMAERERLEQVLRNPVPLTVAVSQKGI